MDAIRHLPRPARGLEPAWRRISPGQSLFRTVSGVQADSPPLWPLTRTNASNTGRTLRLSPRLVRSKRNGACSATRGSAFLVSHRTCGGDFLPQKESLKFPLLVSIQGRMPLWWRLRRARLKWFVHRADKTSKESARARRRQRRSRKATETRTLRAEPGYRTTPIMEKGCFRWLRFGCAWRWPWFSLASPRTSRVRRGRSLDSRACLLRLL
jgi:hypothetical protein